MTLVDVLNGAEKEIEFDAEAPCQTCTGTGAKPGTKPEYCATCGGTGQVVRQQGFFSVATTCPNCAGEGQIIKDPCDDCHGRGRVRAHRKLSVKVPAGVETGTQLRLTGKGEAGELGGPAGDLYVEVRVKKDKRFEREGQHLVVHQKISYLKGLLGAEIEIPTLEDAARVEIPAGTASGDVLRLTGEGLPGLRSSRRGDILIEVEVEIPKKLSKKEEALLREIAKLKGEEVADEKGLFGRFK